MDERASIGTVKEQYREMEIKVVEKQQTDVKTKSILGATTDLVQVFIDVIKTIFDFIKGLVW